MFVLQNGIKEEHVARKQQKIQIGVDFGDMGIHDLLCVRIRPTCHDPDLSNLPGRGPARPAQLSVSAGLSNMSETR